MKYNDTAAPLVTHLMVQSSWRQQSASRRYVDVFGTVYTAHTPVQRNPEAAMWDLFLGSQLLGSFSLGYLTKAVVAHANGNEIPPEPKQRSPLFEQLAGIARQGAEDALSGKTESLLIMPPQMIEQARVRAIEELRSAQGAAERVDGHRQADQALLRLLRALGFHSVVQEYAKVPKVFFVQQEG